MGMFRRKCEAKNCNHELFLQPVDKESSDNGWKVILCREDQQYIAGQGL